MLGRERLRRLHVAVGRRRARVSHPTLDDLVRRPCEREARRVRVAERAEVDGGLRRVICHEAGALEEGRREMLPERRVELFDVKAAYHSHRDPQLVAIGLGARDLLLHSQGGREQVLSELLCRNATSLPRVCDA